MPTPIRSPAVGWSPHLDEEQDHRYVFVARPGRVQSSWMIGSAPAGAAPPDPGVRLGQREQPHGRHGAWALIKTEISTWEELLDLWREFGPAPIWNHVNRALPNANRFKVYALGQSARRSVVWHDACGGSVGTDGGFFMKMGSRW
jgi:hypothetical protein